MKRQKLNNWSAHFHSDPYRPAAAGAVEEEEQNFICCVTFNICSLMVFPFLFYPQVPIVNC
jgi:hypothetical protein